MGVKGDKNSALSNEVAAEFMDRTAGVEGITSKKMFGGHGLFYNGGMFGLVDSKGNCFLKAPEEKVDQYFATGSEKHSRMPYYFVPNNVWTDKNDFDQWVKTAIAEV